MDNLSSNVESNLKIRSPGGQQGAQQVPDTGFNDLDNPGAGTGFYQRQTSQLDTPDVSSMSVDGQNTKKNKF